MRIINIIPSTYQGDPHGALGYAWHKLVVNDSDVDYTQSIPGEDIYGNGIVKIYDILEEQYGEIAIQPHNGYGWLSKTAETRDGQTIDINNATPIAYINAMWCGGLQASIYIVGDNQAAAETPETTTTSGDTLAETAAQDKITEQLNLTEMDARYKNAPGYCTACHSFCFGDCQAT